VTASATLAGLTIAEARDRLRSGDIAAPELAEACLAAAEGSAPLNAFSVVTADLARAQAAIAAVRL
jgi:aspartyl-tRNA(Asn)/glutamyl-tRNA(Gln) amidotransferase subunit A